MLIEMEINTAKREQLIDITAQINAAMATSGPADGICTLFIPHTTAALTVNESADADVAVDILNFLHHMVPLHGDYRHREGNSDAHIKASLLGASLHLPVKGGRLDLGTWQGVFLAEFDGPRRRLVKVWFDS